VRRRSKPSFAQRLRVFWVFIVLALVAASYGGYRLATWPGFQPSTIAVDGNRRVGTDAILARAALPKDRNLWLIDKRAAERRIETIPWIRTAQIHRALPAAVTIVVTERAPIACAQTNDARYMIDEDARVLGTDCGASGALLAVDWPSIPPQQLGATLDVARLQRMLGDVHTLQTMKLDPVRVALDRFDGVEATLRGGPLIRFGEDRDLAEKAKLVDPILRTYGPRAQKLAVIDLRAPSTPVVEERGRPHG
jgi:cell division protein FtsQ